MANLSMQVFGNNIQEMARTVHIETPPNFSFRHTVYSHGWSDLLPFELDETTWTLSYVFTNEGGTAVPASIKESDGRLFIKYDGQIARSKLVRDVAHILRLDDELDAFYGLTEKEDRLRWIASSKAGRLLRSPTVFEDLVKTLCTTNCSWALTRKMVTNLVQTLGEKAVGEKKAFPTPEALASVPESFYRDEIRAGYRSPYFAELAEAVASGKLDPESWLTSEKPTAELKKEIKGVKGIGDYAAENLLKLLGRFDGLALDSWLRAEFYKKHNKARTCSDKKIERFYRQFGEWKGLAMWCDMTERWFDERFPGRAASTAER